MHHSLCRNVLLLGNLHTQASLRCTSSQYVTLVPKIKKKKNHSRRKTGFFTITARVPRGDALGGAVRSLSTLDSGKCLRTDFFCGTVTHQPPREVYFQWLPLADAAVEPTPSRGSTSGSVSPPGAPRPLCEWPGRRAAAAAPPATQSLPCCPRGGGYRAGRGTGRGFPRTAHCRLRRKFLEGQGRCRKSRAGVCRRWRRTMFATSTVCS